MMSLYKKFKALSILKNNHPVVLLQLMALMGELERSEEDGYNTLASLLIVPVSSSRKLTVWLL